MRTLLGYIGKEKHADSLVEKLALRFQAASGPAQWRSLAFCLTQGGGLNLLPPLPHPIAHLHRATSLPWLEVHSLHGGTLLYCIRCMSLTSCFAWYPCSGDAPWCLCGLYSSMGSFLESCGLSRVPAACVFS